MAVKQYFAKSSPHFTNADAQIIGPVLASLAKRGPVSARDVLETAHSTNSPLHKYFEWDDAKAAEMQRLGVAREMVKTVRVRVVSVGAPVRQPAAMRVRSVPTPAPSTPRSAMVRLRPEGEDSYHDALSKVPQSLRIVIPMVCERIVRMIEQSAISQDDTKISVGLLNAAELVKFYSQIFAPGHQDHPYPNFGIGRAASTAPSTDDAPTRRFADHADFDPANVKGLPATHLALVDGRTLFPSTVVAPADSPALLVSGANSRKLGDRVTKGPWRGFPIYQLSLEERATCPRTCHHWATCYGNGMQMARRHRNDEDLLPYLRAELVDLQDEYPRGFVVRLHVLGDFFSPEYVEAWEGFLDQFPALHVFGYTAWQRGTDIGDAIKAVTDRAWERFAIRFSSNEPQAQGATTIWRVPEDSKVREGIVCPAQTDKTDCCGTCGLCWAVEIKDQPIAFMAHGRKTKPAAA